MPFSLTSGSSNGGGVTGEVSLSSFKLQASYPPAQINTELTELVNFPNPCRIYIFNEGPNLAEIRFAATDENESAILIDPGVSWVETFSSVALWAKSEGQSKIRITLLFNESPAEEPNAGLPITPLEIISGEPNTGFEVTESPVQFTLEVRRENTDFQLDGSIDLDILLYKIYEETILPVDLTTDSFSSNEYNFVNAWINNSEIWQQQITVDSPGKYFLGSEFNMAGYNCIARLDFDLVNSKISFISEIAI